MLIESKKKKEKEYQQIRKRELDDVGNLKEALEKEK